MLSFSPPYFNKTILVCPLDWGLGHAARCVPLIKQLQKQGNRVIIGCTDWQEEFLKRELSDVTFTRLFGYDVKYSKRIALGLKMLWQMPRISLVIKKETTWLKQYLKKNKVDVVISDNRYGLYHPTTECVFITHQLFIPSPILKQTVHKINLSFIKKFSACWVPDHEDAAVSLSGSLSRGGTLPANAKFIGPLSRFEARATALKKEFDLLILLSGVEPQRTLLEKTLTGALHKTKLKIALVRGTTSAPASALPAHFTVFEAVNTAQQCKLMASSDKIICRSGYSTLMDLHALGIKALLVPTPGQAEQEYLADYWKENFGFTFLNQDEITPESISVAMGLKRNPALQKQ